MQRRAALLVSVIVLVVSAMYGHSSGSIVRIAAAADEPPGDPHGNYQEDCELCHSDEGWKPARISKKFDHGRFVPLAGAHAAVSCTQCHKSLDFAMAPAACVDCHADVHNGELGTDCARCHGMRSFVDRNDQIRLHRVTRFPLSGAHVTLDCEMCHALAAPDAYTYVNTPSECSSCHTADYRGTTDPDHESVGFPTDCMHCHDQVSWSRARFEHAGTGFPLTGAHVPLVCERCHVGGVFGGLSSACVSCHQGDYDTTNDPAHAAAGFSTDCAQCHTTRGWGGANFNHTALFPIYSGAHAGKWSSCGTCHVNAASYADFSCFGCHPHSDQAKTDEKHAGMNGYSYDSNACYSCHPNGKKE
jgi:Zn finger protein HypA/HybF involved in hydrogenase expression